MATSPARRLPASVLVADHFGIRRSSALLIVLPLMAVLGWVAAALCLDRSLRGGALVPILATFGLAIVIENLLFEEFGADTRSLAPYIGALSTQLAITDAASRRRARRC